MDIESIKQQLAAFLNKENLHLYDVSTRIEEDEKVLEVILDESLDLEQLSTVSFKVSQFLEEYSNDYLIDISCVGIERPLRSWEEVVAHTSDYICVTLQNGEEIEGDLLVAENNELLLRVKNKNLFKKVKVTYAEVVAARLAVKF